MRKLILSAISISLAYFASAQCTTTNATGCQCLDGSTNCDLLPNITMANEPLEVIGTNGVIEYSQTGNGVENGRLRVSVSTPNIGRGPLTILSTQTFICGADTFTSNPGTCPDGSAPRQLIKQRIYRKNGNTMTFNDRPAGSMTYHPTHSHMHVDDWGEYTLRIRDTTEPNPLLWPILGSGAKLGFCLMDYGSCSYYAGHCEDSAGNVLLNANFPNYGLGGGNYNCSPTIQGISSGYTDIYYQNLDGMYIQIPPGTCNGDYYIVVVIDPHNYFLEEKENDNVIAIPFTLTKQVPVGSGTATISVTSGSETVCESTPVVLSANQGSSYVWSNGATTQTITVTQPGTYQVQVNSQCGSANSQPVTINHIPNHFNAFADASTCEGGNVTLEVEATGTVYWYASDTATNAIHSGETYTVAPAANTVYFAETRDTLAGVTGFVGPAANNIGAGGFLNNAGQYQTFNVSKPLVIKRVTVYANSTRNRTFQLRNSSGGVLSEVTLMVQQGTQTVDLNFTVAPGNGYQLGVAAGTQPDLYRNSAGPSYPYNFANIISVTGSSAGASYWYYMYNWEIEQLPVACASVRIPVQAVVNPLPNVQIAPLDTAYYENDAPVALQGTPAGGVFSGQGVAGGEFNPQVAGVGGPYTITYQYTDSLGCSGQSSWEVSVLQAEDTFVTNIATAVSAPFVRVYPNPNNGLFELSVNSKTAETFALQMVDNTGRVIMHEPALNIQGTFRKAIDVRNVAKGTYQIHLISDKHKSVNRVVIH